MALVINDRVKETSTTTGTGTLDLAGAVQDFEGFVAGIGNSNKTYYAIVNTGTGEFEVGLGTVTDAATDTLSRDTIISSSNSDAAVNFSAGTKDVFCTLPASKAVVEDENNDVTLPADLTIGANLDVSSGTIKLNGNFPVGSENVALGDGCFANLTSSAQTNTAVGTRALQVGDGNQNTALGYSAGLNNTGDNNTFLGRGAGFSMTSGSENIVIGANATASSNTVSNEVTIGNTNVTSLRIPGLQSGASANDVLTFNGTDITLSTPSTGVSKAFVMAMGMVL